MLDKAFSTINSDFDIDNIIFASYEEYMVIQLIQSSLYFCAMVFIEKKSKQIKYNGSAREKYREDDSHLNNFAQKIYPEEGVKVEVDRVNHILNKDPIKVQNLSKTYQNGF